MAMRAKAYPIDTKNGTVEFDLPGQYFKILSASAARPVDVQLLKDGQGALDASQVSQGFYQRVEFNKLRITDSGVQSLVVLAAPDEGGQDSIVGLVDINPFAGGDAITSAGTGFVAGWNLAAVAAQNANLQLYNPGASGKVLYIDTLELASSLAGFIDIAFTNTARATLIFTGKNRTVGGAASVGELRSESAAGLFGTTILRTRVPADVSVTLNFNPPYRLPAGQGLGAGNSPVNADLSANYFYREKST